MRGDGGLSPALHADSEDRGTAEPPHDRAHSPSARSQAARGAAVRHGRCAVLLPGRASCGRRRQRAASAAGDQGTRFGHSLLGNAGIRALENARRCAAIGAPACRVGRAGGRYGRTGHGTGKDRGALHRARSGSLPAAPARRLAQAAVRTAFDTPGRARAAAVHHRRANPSEGAGSCPESAGGVARGTPADRRPRAGRGCGRWRTSLALRSAPISSARSITT